MGTALADTGNNVDTKSCGSVRFGQIALTKPLALTFYESDLPYPPLLVLVYGPWPPSLRSSLALDFS